MIRQVPSRWRTVLLVCGNCERKLEGGFGPHGDRRLSKLLRKRADGKGRKARFGVVETGCLKLCPKRAVTVVDANQPGDWLVVPVGTPIEEVETLAGLDSPSGPRPATAIGASPTPQDVSSRF